jgi:hypothetical protein
MRRVVAGALLAAMLALGAGVAHADTPADQKLYALMKSQGIHVTTPDNVRKLALEACLDLKAGASLEEVELASMLSNPVTRRRRLIGPSLTQCTCTAPT